MLSRFSLDVYIEVVEKLAYGDFDDFESTILDRWVLRIKAGDNI